MEVSGPENPCHHSDPGHCCDNARYLPHCATRELHISFTLMKDFMIYWNNIYDYPENYQTGDVEGKKIWKINVKFWQKSLNSRLIVYSWETIFNHPSNSESNSSLNERLRNIISIISIGPYTWVSRTIMIMLHVIFLSLNRKIKIKARKKYKTCPALTL